MSSATERLAREHAGVLAASRRNLARAEAAEAAEARFEEWSKLAVSLQIRVSELEAALKRIKYHTEPGDYAYQEARDALKGEGQDS